MPIEHPCKNEDGETVYIRRPHLPSPLSEWHDATQITTVVPAGAMPPQLNGVALRSWEDVPQSEAQWRTCVENARFAEPRFVLPADKRPAAGAVILEPDGRVWIVAPSNQFAGNLATFPKGHVDRGSALRQTAVRECFEESGLWIELVAHLIDSTRAKTHNRYYLARRVGGTPADMGWESQAVHLAPIAALKDLLNNPADHLVLEALLTLGEAGVKRIFEERACEPMI
jgi:ADP-ribose pyrophosphatase YjhB (NUDIX family)